jgi:hypothetical protein
MKTDQPVNSEHLRLANQVASLFASLPQVKAIALAGSSRNATSLKAVDIESFSDASSDIDLYVYTKDIIPLATRVEIVKQSGGASETSLDLNYWGLGDEWYNQPTGIEVDIIYFDALWMEEQIARVISQHQASQGYTTCLWYTIHQSSVIADLDGWFTSLQAKCQVEYPEPLRQNIIALNHPVLRGIIPSYTNQIIKAVKRKDLVSINHRLAALLASYFDILFAFNRQLHPGEKRLVEKAASLCEKNPENMQADLTKVLESAAGELQDLPYQLECLLDRLDELLNSEGILINP